MKLINNLRERQNKNDKYVKVLQSAEHRYKKNTQFTEIFIFLSFGVSTSVNELRCRLTCKNSSDFFLGF